MAKAVKLHNPSSLWIVNPKRRNKVVRRKRRTATTNRRTRRSNPKRRTAIVVNRRSTRSNQRFGARRNRRRNPQFKTLIQGGLYAAAGAMTFSIISGFIPIRAAGLPGIGIQLGIAYVTAMVGERLLPGGSQFFAAGAAAAVGKSLIDWALGLVRGPLTGALASPSAPTVGAPDTPAPTPTQGVSGWGDDYYLSDVVDGSGMSDVVPQPDYWPNY